MKEYLIEKYEGYIELAEFQKDNIYITPDTEYYLKMIEDKIVIYREILTDLKML